MKNKFFGTTLICVLTVFASLACGKADSDEITVEMVKIPGGTFIMGSPKSENWNSGREIQHTVTVSDFYMGKYEVTQKQYKAVMGYNPNKFEEDNLPTEYVSWYDAVEFCNKLSEREELEPVYTMADIRRGHRPVSHRYGNYSFHSFIKGYHKPIDKATVTADWNKNGYRLPTEAEWEYACRAGTRTPFNTGDSITTEQANYDGEHQYNQYNENIGGIYRRTATPVGSFAPNAWDLYDMHGNVAEWCWDYAADYSPKAQVNPRGPDKASEISRDPEDFIGFGHNPRIEDGTSRIYRGGHWYYIDVFLRSAARDIDFPLRYSQGIGFRVARNL